jgi:hypothetical protein
MICSSEWKLYISKLSPSYSSRIIACDVKMASTLIASRKRANEIMSRNIFERYLFNKAIFPK